MLQPQTIIPAAEPPVTVPHSGAELLRKARGVAALLPQLLTFVVVQLVQRSTGRNPVFRTAMATPMRIRQVLEAQV